MGSCDFCDKPAAFGAIAVRVVDGELLSSADYCLQHARNAALGLASCGLSVVPEHVGDLLDDCYRNRCECLPKRMYRCARCTRIADVWLTAGLNDDLSDVRRGIELCGPCVQSELSEGQLPPEVRRELRGAAQS